MSAIRFERNHALGRDGARKAAEALAQALAEKFQLRYQWVGDELNFHRSGADGKLGVGDDRVTFELKLGLLLRPLKGAIEGEVEHYFQQYFGRK